MSFNSTLVQLKVRELFLLDYTILRFNSTLVQLKDEGQEKTKGLN